MSNDVTPAACDKKVSEKPADEKKGSPVEMSKQSQNDSMTPSRLMASQKVMLAFFFVCLGVILYLSFQILRPFLEVLIVSAAAANLSYPVYKRITRWIGGRANLGAALTLAILCVIVVIPVIIYSSILYL